MRVPFGPCVAASTPIPPGETREVIVAHAGGMRWTGHIDVTPEVRAAFTIERFDRLLPAELALLCDEPILDDKDRPAPGVLFRVRNNASRPLSFRAQLELLPDAEELHAAITSPPRPS